MTRAHRVSRLRLWAARRRFNKRLPRFADDPPSPEGLFYCPDHGWEPESVFKKRRAQ